VSARNLAIGVVVLAVLAAGGDFIYHRHGHFDFEEIPGFFSALGLVGGLVMVALGLAARTLLRRDVEDAP